MKRQRSTVLYYFFYLIFSIWFWRILFGFVIGLGLGYGIGTQGMGKGGAVMLWIMVLGTGWWVAYPPASMTARVLKKIFARPAVRT